jgi:hypothetical protein
MRVTSIKQESTAPPDDDLFERPSDSEMPVDRSGFDRPAISMEEFVANGAGVFKSDEELDDFLAFLHELRHGNDA